MIKTDEKGNVLEFTYELAGATVVVQNQLIDTQYQSAVRVDSVAKDFITGINSLVFRDGRKWDFKKPADVDDRIKALPNDSSRFLSQPVNFVCRLVSEREVKDPSVESGVDVASKEASEFLAGLMAEMNDLIEEKIEMAIKVNKQSSIIADFTQFEDNIKIRTVQWSDGFMIREINGTWEIAEDLGKIRSVLIKESEDEA